MAISFVATGAVVNTSGPGTSGLTVTVPAVSNSDFLLMLSGRTGTASGGYNTPSGWTNIAEWTMSTPTNARHCWAAYRIASSEPASYALTHNDAAEEQWGALILAWAGVDTSTPLDQTSVGDITQNDTNDGDPPSITTQTANAWVVAFNYIRPGGDPTAFTPPSSYTERLDRVGANINLSVADRLIVAAGAENPGVFTSGGSTNVCDHIVGTLALRPAAAGGAGTIPAMFMGSNLGKLLINGGSLKC